jgi:hypothetical protein
MNVDQVENEWKEVKEKAAAAMVYQCPHCLTDVVIEKRNCGVFIHAVYKHNGKQVNPHMGETQRLALIKRKKILGCGNRCSI